MYDNAVAVAKEGFLTPKEIDAVVKLYDEYGYDFFKLNGKKEKFDVLLEAALYENYELLNSFISLGKKGNYDIVNHFGDGILSYLCDKKETTRTDAEFTTLVHSLVATCGANINIVTSRSSYNEEPSTPLMTTAHYGQLNRVKTLVENGANVKFSNDLNRAALYYTESLAVAKYLVSKGADPLQKDKWDQTMLFYIANPDLASYYLSLGVDPSAKNTNGQTALFAVKDAKVTTILLGKGCDVNLKDNEGHSILFTNILTIRDAMVKFDEDIQDKYIPKFKLMISKGLDPEIIKADLDFFMGDYDAIPKVMELFGR